MELISKCLVLVPLTQEKIKSSKAFLRMNKIEHIGIAVKDLSEASKVYTQLLGYEPYKTETVESEGVTTMFFKTGDTKIELLEADNDESPIAKFIDKRGEGIHHIAFAVDNIKEEVI